MNDPQPSTTRTNAGRRVDVAASRHALLAQAFELMAAALGGFIDERMVDYFADEPSWSEAAANRLGRPAEHGATDPLFQLLVLRRFWGPVFAEFFGTDLRGIITELIDTRNQWAHFNLPDRSETLERSILAMERLTAPVEPETTRVLRQLRSQIGGPSTARAEPGGSGSGAHPNSTAPGVAPTINVAALEAQLSETESVFQDLQDRHDQTLTELKMSRRMAADKQLRVSALEQQLREIEDRTLAAEEFLLEERTTRYRIEWLFVGLLATILLFLVLATA